VAHVPGNQWTLALGKQSAKGTAQTTPTYKLKATGGDIVPNRERITLEESDASAQEAATVIVGADCGGTPEFYIRPADAGLTAYAALGAISSTVGPTNFVHTITPANIGPYLTGFKAIGATALVDRYMDLRPRQITWRGQTKQPLTCALDVFGLSFLLNQTDPALTPVTDTPFTWPEITVSKGGVDPHTIEAFEITANRNATVITGDNGLSAYDLIWGKFSVRGTLTLLFENDDDYNNFHGGSPSATTPTTTVPTEALTITATRGANTSMAWVMTGISAESYPVNMNTAGTPIMVSMGFKTEPQATLANNLSVILANQTASY
jgi:hypothetical protein